MTGSATSAPAPGQSSAERPVPAAHRVPAGTTTLFALLIAGVLATTSVVYVLLYGAVPLHHRIFLKTLRVCEAREPGLALSSDKGNNLPWEADALTRIQGCMAPVYRGEVAWAVSGVVLVFVLALLLYWVRPWWLIRRRLLKPIGDSDLKLVEDLEKWSEETGLEPPPTFLIAADDRVGAEAFGRIGRRYVQLNAALVDLRTDDEGNADVAGEAQFRAGVLHELAHLRNRDVDKTEFAYAIVTSFTIVAVLPMVWLVLRPAVLSTVVSSGPADVGLALLTLAAVVVLTGLAVRRTRELHADAQAVHHERHPKPADDLRALIERISKPADEHAGESVREFAKAHWPAALRTHPSKPARLGAIGQPEAALLRNRLWELFGAGIVTAVIAANIGFFLATAMPRQAIIDHALPGAICVPGLAGLLGVAMWRAVVLASPFCPPLREIVLPPVALAAGLLFGEPIALINTAEPFSLHRTVVAGAILLVGGLALAAWLASAIRAVRIPPGRDRRWGPILVIVAGVIAITPWFTVWTLSHDNGEVLLGARLGDVPAPGGSIGWYAILTRWIEASYTPLGLLYYNPLTLTALALLWLVPVAIAGSRWPAEPPFTLRPALAAGVAGGVICALAGVTAAYTATSALPLRIRSSDDFIWAAVNFYVTAAVLVQAAIAAVLAACVRRHRAVLIPLAIMLTGALATLLFDVGVMPASQCIDTFGNAGRLGLACLKPRYSATSLAGIAHWILIKGALAAFPGALIGAAIAAWRARRNPIDVPGPKAPHTDGEPTRQNAVPAASHKFPAASHESHTEPAAASAGRRKPLVQGSAVLLLLAALLAAGGLQQPVAYRTWVTSAPPATAVDPGTTRNATTVPCLIGTWTEARRVTFEHFAGTEVRWTGKGVVQRFTADGIAIIDFGTANRETATIGGQPGERVTTGTITARYQTRNGKIVYNDPVARGTTTWKINGVLRRSGPLTPSLEPTDFTCRDGTMAQDSESSTIDMRHTAEPAATLRPAPSGNDPCVIGTWIETSHATYVNGWWIGKGIVQRFRADGTGAIDYGAGNVIAPAQAPATKITTAGTTTFRYQTRQGQITYSHVSSKGTVTGTVGNTVRFRKPLNATSLTPDTYTCQNGTMSQSGSHYTIHMIRISEAP